MIQVIDRVANENDIVETLYNIRRLLLIPK